MEAPLSKVLVSEKMTALVNCSRMPRGGKLKRWRILREISLSVNRIFQIINFSLFLLETGSGYPMPLQMRGARFPGPKLFRYLVEKCDPTLPKTAPPFSGPTRTLIRT